MEKYHKTSEKQFLLPNDSHRFKNTVLVIIIILMKQDLESGSFSNSDQEDETLLVPTPEMISKYNRQYSTIVKQIQRFLKQAIESVQKFVTFHNFGVDFNLPNLLNNLYLAGNSFKLHLTSSNQQDVKDRKKRAKEKYQVSFNNLIHRMSNLFKDMVDFEVQFKKSYFGSQNNNQASQKNKIKRSFSVNNRSVSSVTKSSTSQKLKINQFIEIEAKEQQKEAELRITLNQRLKPMATAPQAQCKLQYSTTENLYRLNEKIELMLNDMKAMRSRQQKLIELFNLNRVKKIHAVAQELPSPLNTSTISSISPINEEDHQEVDQILEDWRGRQSPSIHQADDGHSTNRFLKKRNIY